MFIPYQMKQLEHVSTEMSLHVLASMSGHSLSRNIRLHPGSFVPKAEVAIPLKSGNNFDMPTFRLELRL